jgi:hypothetical protein
MADNLERKFPKGSLRITTGCQYCAVGCGYNAFLSPTQDCDGDITFKGVSKFITPAMRGEIKYKGDPYFAAVAPDVRCDLNKGNHSVRGGSQGHNLVSPDRKHNSTKDRLLSPQVRIREDGKEKLVDIDLGSSSLSISFSKTPLQQRSCFTVQSGHPMLPFMIAQVLQEVVLLSRMLGCAHMILRMRIFEILMSS